MRLRDHMEVFKAAFSARSYVIDQRDQMALGACVMVKHEGDTLFKALLPITALRPNVYLQGHLSDAHKEVRIPITEPDSLAPRELNGVLADVERGETVLRKALHSDEPINPRLALIAIARNAVAELTDEERLDLFTDYCKACGKADPSCQCWNDE